MAILWQIGGLSFESEPVSPATFERETGGDFVAKEVVGAQRPREAVGLSDEVLHFTAELYPFHFNGLPAIDVLDAIVKSQQPQPVMRGDGRWMGFYYVDKVGEKHSEIGQFGIGRKIELTIQCTLEPDPDADDMDQFLSLF